jgi:DNA-binding MarR family transcriptional regulator
MIREISPLTEDIQEIESTFLLLSEFTKNKILEGSIKNEITCGQFEILSLLDKTGIAAVHDIVESQSLTSPACTVLIDGLSRLNLVTRNRSGSDRRLVNVSITGEGRELLNKIRTKRHNILKSILEKMTEQEIIIIRQSLGILKKKLNILGVSK